jgi:hypothetical protein
LRDCLHGGLQAGIFPGISNLPPLPSGPFAELHVSRRGQTGASTTALPLRVKISCPASLQVGTKLAEIP